ncbi:MAG: class I SAM-dependent methyltransferase [Deltaproteobacteria bacterium]|nr:class I SAM-dependent methyltransferase [Deltaproteobacteria bacterium]
MERIPEPEIMDEAEQVRAYAEANFEEPHSQIIANIRKFLPAEKIKGSALDLGCGPGDIVLRLLKAFPEINLTAIDGSKNMLLYAENAARRERLSERVRFVQALIPHLSLDRTFYDFIFSNSLLHHLHNPNVLWETIKRYSRKGTQLFIGDLIRPESTGAARKIVETYSANEPEVLRQDFYNSLLAAFTLEEVKDQLRETKLSLTTQTTSDRHMVVFGEI